MFPNLPFNDSADSCLAEFESGGKLNLIHLFRRIDIAYTFNICLGNFNHTMLFSASNNFWMQTNRILIAFRRVASTLCRFVLHIIGMCSKKEMIWIYAARVVAA